MTTAARSSFWKPRSHGQVAVQPHPLRWGERRHGAADAHYEPALIAPSGGDRTLINTWDADSNRVGMNANGTAYAFVYDTTAGIPAVLEESTSGSTVYYIREPGGSLLARLNSSDGIRYYHFDELGSTRLLTDGSGTVTDRYAYDAYGSVLSHDCYSGSVSQPYQYVGQLGYYTHYQEPEFGLLQLGVRFYDAPVGRFTQRDPVQHGVDYYEYALGIPTSLADPSGLLPNQGDWAKKAFKCAWKAGKKCAGKTGTEFDMCYWSEFGNCMGKAWTKASCEASVCTLFPRAVYCWNGNACDRWRRGDKHYCQDCCDLKWACCWIEAMMWSTTPAAAVLAVKSCTDENTACKIKCQCPK